MDSSPERDHDASGDHDLEHYVQHGGEHYEGMEDHYEGHEGEEYDDHHGHYAEDEEGHYGYQEGHEGYDHEEGESHEHGGYGHQGYEDHEEHEDHEGEEGHEDHQPHYGYRNEYADYGEGEITEFDMMFENAARKIKRDILDNLNKMRQEKGHGKLYTDLFSTLIANDYAEFLKSNDDDTDVFKQLCDEYNNYGELKLVCTKSKLEEDTNINEAFYQELINLGYLLLEVESDRKILLDGEMNHVGIGVAMTEDSVILVEVFSKKMISVSKISDGEDGGIEVRGKMLVDTHGLYYVRLQGLETKKDLLIIGPEKIEFDRATKDFIAFLDIEETIAMSNKTLEFYVRVKPETIEYKKPTTEKVNLKYVELVLRAPCITYPDPRYLHEDEQDRTRKEQEALEKMRIEEEKRKQKEQERRERKEARRLLRQEIEERRARGEEIESLASSTNRSDRSFMSKSSLVQKQLEATKSNFEGLDKQGSFADKSQDPERSDMSPQKTEDKSGMEDDKLFDPEKMGRGIVDSYKEPAVSNKEILDELRIAIAEAEKQLNTLQKENEELQQKIILMRQRNDGYVENKQDVPMTEPKYLNTLAHVHQIRLDLKQTQDRYNRMAAELQMKLEEKQAKCYDIKKAFMDLKREVCKKAAYSRTDKPIPEKKIEEWEDRENAKSKELQSLRLENLRLRNQLAKNQKILKKKEELAEGLHLIDFEQLKIENQINSKTLNEKIEERNEDLHKLKKKNTNTVQILTHYKEKLEYVVAENQVLEEGGSKLETTLSAARTFLNGLKKDKKNLQVLNQQLSQQTGIVNSKLLKVDYDQRKKEIEKDKKLTEYFKKKHEYMLKVIEEYNKKVATKKLTIGNVSTKVAYMPQSLTGSQMSMMHPH